MPIRNGQRSTEGLWPIHALREAGTTFLVVEQNAAIALSVADRGYVLETGRIVRADRGQALLVNERVKEAYLGV
jgi:branched-chain amino acid transport system ATP-binding protein